MRLVERLSLDELAPSRLWSELDTDTRLAAARSLYRGSGAGEAGRREADAAIAAQLRFRELMVRRMPVDKRVNHVGGKLRPDDSLAASLLLALHLDQRKALLESFLDDLEIPQSDGVIGDDFETDELTQERLAPAVERLYARFPEPEVDLYLMSLLALEPETWSTLRELMASAR